MDERTLARFMSKVEAQPNGCWRWLGKPTSNGYGRFQFSGNVYRAHRVSFEHFNGPIPKGAEPDHRCHTEDITCPGGVSCPHRMCVNPAHLEAVTRRENSRRGRGFCGVNAARTECVKGHPFDEKNTYWTKNGNRQCRTCRDEAARAWHAAHDTRNGNRPGNRTHCPAGHAYEGDNVRIDPSGRRVCRACKRARYHEYKSKRPQLMS